MLLAGEIWWLSTELDLRRNVLIVFMDAVGISRLKKASPPTSEDRPQECLSHFESRACVCLTRLDLA